MWSSAEELSSTVLSIGHGATSQLCQLVGMCSWGWRNRQQSLLAGWTSLAPTAHTVQSRGQAAQDFVLPSHLRSPLRDFLPVSEGGARMPWSGGSSRSAQLWHSVSRCPAVPFFDLSPVCMLSTGKSSRAQAPLLTSLRLYHKGTGAALHPW